MSQPASADRFYDLLAAQYHLLYPAWDAAISEQAATLSRLIESALGPAKGKVLDWACGIGTQSLGLASLGYDVTGTDVSRHAVGRAAREVRRRRLASAHFDVADVRRLPATFRDAFDVAIGCDNPLAHLLGREELRIAFLGLRTALRAGGLLVLSSRDYDALAVERPREVGFRHYHFGHKTAIVFQLWEWDEAKPTYVNNHFILTSSLLGWRTHRVSTTMRAYTRAEIAEELEAAGFTAIIWRGPKETGYFQHIVTAVSPS
jgi:glycine/sarcosine N-methyltransferase